MLRRKTLQLPSSLSIAQASFFNLKVKVWRCNGSAFAPRTLVKFLHVVSVCSERSYPVVSIEAWRSINYPKYFYFASCTTSLFYVRLSKNSFLLAHQVSSWKRMQRYDFFPNNQNFSKKKFTFYRKKFEDLIYVKHKYRLHLIIIMRAREQKLFALTTLKEELTSHLREAIK